MHFPITQLITASMDGDGMRQYEDYVTAGVHDGLI
jgi:hypothetical protein